MYKNIKKIKRGGYDVFDINIIQENMIIVFEGLDGSGKTTHINLLYEKLILGGYDTLISPWRRGKGIVNFLQRITSNKFTSSKDGSLVFASEFWTRWDLDKERINSNKKILIYDRYIYTEIVRGISRNLNSTWIKSLYDGATEPDIVFYFYCSNEELYLRRKDTEISFFEAGFDCYCNSKKSFSENYIDFNSGKYSQETIIKAFCNFQEKLNLEYQKLNGYNKFIPINTSGKSHEEIHEYISNHIKALDISI